MCVEEMSYEKLSDGMCFTAALAQWPMLIIVCRLFAGAETPAAGDAL